MNEFLLSDETLNSYGFVVRTSGINLDRFKANPVMYYNHAREKGIAGKWEKLRIESGKLFGTPVFDISREPGKTAGEQAESGFLNGASIGIDNILMADIGGVQTVVSCELNEVSVCDIPSNQNALQLYYDGAPVTLSTYKELSLNKKSMGTTYLQRIAQSLSLPDTATVDEVCNMIKTLAALLPGSVTLMMDDAIQSCVITKEESEELLTLAANNPLTLSKYLKKRKESNTKTLSVAYDKFISENCNKFTGFQNDKKLKELALHDLDTFKRFAGLIRKPLKPMDVLNLSSSNQRTKADWTLEDYRRLSPKELSQNPDLYQRLIQEDKERRLNN